MYTRMFINPAQLHGHELTCYTILTSNICICTRNCVFVCVRAVGEAICKGVFQLFGTQKFSLYLLYLSICESRWARGKTFFFLYRQRKTASWKVINSLFIINFFVYIYIFKMERGENSKKKHKNKKDGEQMNGHINTSTMPCCCWTILFVLYLYARSILRTAYGHGMMDNKYLYPYSCAISYLLNIGWKTYLFCVWRNIYIYIHDIRIDCLHGV